MNPWYLRRLCKFTAPASNINSPSQKLFRSPYNTDFVPITFFLCFWVFLLMWRGVRHQKNTYIFIRKYQEIPKKFRKYLEISENTCKFQEILGNIWKFCEIPGNTRPQTSNTRKYFVKNMKYVGIFTRLLFDLSFFIDWVLNYFTLFTGIYEMSSFMKTNKYKFYQK
jgi:hypothetical protein